jgi:Na+/H+-dicarboxylate symporter
MKIWIKYLLGCILGIIATLVLPTDNLVLQKIIAFLTDFAIRFGRYMLLPLLFFSMTISVCNLREENKLFKVFLQTVAVIVLSSFVLMFIGLISALLIKLPRIPISGEKLSTPIILGLSEKILNLLPDSPFEALLDGAFLVPLYVFAGFAGAGFASDRVVSKPAYNLFDSLSHVCYLIMSFFVDMLAIGMIAISCTWTIQFISLLKTGVYTGFIIMLFVDFVLIVGIIYPLIMRFIFKEMRPYRILYASIAPILTAFFSTDANLSLIVNIRHSKESIGIRRRLNSIVMPIFSSFGRGGTACVTTISFIVILRSYSGLGIAFTDIIWIALVSFGLSFVLGAIPMGGPFVAISVICSLYGRGFDAGYLLLKPAIPVICAVATAIDTVTALLGSYLIASKNKWIERKDMKKYI